MDPALTDREKYAAAKAHVAKIKGFYIHLVVFAAVMTGLAGVDYAKGGTWWVQWPLIGWGFGVLCHAYLVFGRPVKAGPTWEKRKIKETMAKM